MILDAILGERLATAKDAAFWADVLGSKTAAGVSVNEDSALNFSGVYRAVALIAGSVSSLPFHVYRRQQGDRRVRQDDHPLDRLLNQEPNAEMDALTFRETLQAHVLTWGNGYAEIRRAGAHPVALEILQPNKTKPDRVGGQIVYRVQRAGRGSEDVLDASRVLHVKNLGGDGLAGWSTVRRAREAIGLAGATEQFGGSFFGNGTRPGGVLKHPTVLKETAAKRLRQSWQEMHQGPANAHQVAILEEGMTWEALGIPPEDAQFLETRKFQITEIARWFGVPPHLLGDLERATFSNIEHQLIEFLIFSLRYWLTKWERALNRSLLLEDEKSDHYTQHVIEDLVRGDIVTRFNAYKVGREGGWLSANDVLRKENQNPIGPQGDIYLVPANMVPATSLLEPDEPDDEPDGDEPAPPEPPPVDPPADDEEDDLAVRRAHRRVLAESLGRLARKEISNARQAAKKPDQFLTWLNEYYVHHARLLAQAIEPGLEAWLTVLGRAAEAAGLAAALAGAWVSRSSDDLLEAAGAATPAELPAAVEACLTGWSERAAHTAQGVVP